MVCICLSWPKTPPQPTAAGHRRCSFDEEDIENGRLHSRFPAIESTSAAWQVPSVVPRAVSGCMKQLTYANRSSTTSSTLRQARLRHRARGHAPRVRHIFMCEIDAVQTDHPQRHLHALRRCCSTRSAASRACRALYTRGPRARVGLVLQKRALRQDACRVSLGPCDGDFCGLA